MKPSRRAGWALVAVAAWALLPVAASGRVSLSVFILIGLYVPIVAGISLLAGYAGQVSLGQAAFYGLGAYGSAILSARFGIPTLLSVPAAIVITGALAYLIGRPILLLRGHYLVVATLGFNVIVSVLLRQWDSLTGGASGIKDIPPLAIGPFRVHGDLAYYYVTGLVAAAALRLCGNLVRSRFGRALQAIRTSETAAETLGVDPSRQKAAVFVISAMLAAAPGALYAHYLAYVNPTPFEFTFSVEVLTMAVIGGLPHVPGAVAGVALAVLLREALRSVVPVFNAGASAGPFESIAFGALLAAVTVLSPDGLWPRLRDGAVRGLARLGLGTGGMPDPEEAGLRRESGERSPDVAASPSAPGGPLLRVEGARRDFGGLTAVNDVSFEVRAGEVFAVIGPNGAGKTTLFNLVSGVLRASGGRILLDGRAIDGLPAHRVASLGVARTFQTPRLAARLTARENVMTGLHRRLGSGVLRSLFGLSRIEEARAREEADRLLRELGAEAYRDTPAAELPFGALRLVELARALASHPKLLLLDEPASGLTAQERASLFHHIRRARDAGVAVLLVEHDVDFVLGLADRVLVLHHGVPVACGAPDEIRNDERVIAAYLGTPRAAGGGAAAKEAAEGEASRSAGPSAAGTAGARSGRPLLSARRVVARYGRVTALHGATFEVHEGEVVAILGPNGAGKSTLMRAVAGLLPSEGDISFDDHRLNRLPPERIVGLGVALVPERRELLESMSVRDHLLLGAYARRRRDARSAIAEDLDFVTGLFPVLREKAAQPARALSGGQQQMLAIARALMSRPRVLLFDEPLLGLAPTVVAEILDTIQRLRQRGLAVVIVEQNAATVLPACDRAYVLRAGRIVLEGTPSQLAGDAELQASFLGRTGGGRAG